MSSILVEVGDSLSNLMHFIWLVSELLEEKNEMLSKHGPITAAKSLIDGSNPQLMCVSDEWLQRNECCFLDIFSVINTSQRCTKKEAYHDSSWKT